MPEALNNLIDRIQKEGIEEADKAAVAIIAAAEKQAAEITAAATKQAAEITARARKEAELLDQRGRASLAQAARDTLLTVTQAIDAVFAELARRALAEALNPETLRTLLKTVVEHYFDDPTAARAVAIKLSAADTKAIGQQLMAEFGAAVAQGLTIGADNELIGGFRVALKDEHLFHDFTREAMAELLCAFLRPELAEITRKAVGDDAVTT